MNNTGSSNKGYKKYSSKYSCQNEKNKVVTRHATIRPNVKVQKGFVIHLVQKPPQVLELVLPQMYYLVV